MTIPDFQEIKLALLELAKDQKEHSLSEARDILVDSFKITEKERREVIPSGKQKTFINRVGWALIYLKNAGLMKSTRRGYFIITD